MAVIMSVVRLYLVVIPREKPLKKLSPIFRKPLKAVSMCSTIV
jgi:hypothetical protein